MSRCPSARQLDELLDEQLPDADRRAVSQHVSACAACQAALERLTADTEAPGASLSAVRPRPAGDTNSLAPFLARLKDSSVLWGTPSAPGVGHRRGTSATPSGTPTVPGYEILAELGRGGMGVVYKARQVGLNRLVALKMILAGSHAGPKELARFRHEAEAVARLHHPNIVQIYDVGDADGMPYCALELVPEGSLARRLRGDPQPLEPAVRLVETLARAVHFAHRQGVVRCYFDFVCFGVLRG